MSELATTDAWIDAVNDIQGVFLDAYVVVGREGTIEAFNRLFYTLFPRRVARKLKGGRLSEVIDLDLPASQEGFDPVQECLQREGPVRFDEVEGRVGGGQDYQLIVAATPLAGGEAVLVVFRDVTDEAQVQTKYKQMLQEEADAKAQLEDVLRRRTRELLTANDRLNAMQAELLQFRKGLLLS